MFFDQTAEGGPGLGFAEAADAADVRLRISMKRSRLSSFGLLAESQSLWISLLVKFQSGQNVAVGAHSLVR